MEDNFRNVLIILSAIAISAIFIHGLWTIRKQKNPYKLKTSKERIEPISRDFDRKGFDQDGVGQVKITPTSESSPLNREEPVVVEPIFTVGTQLSDDLSTSQILIKKDVLAELAGHVSDVEAAQVDNSAEQQLDNSLEEEWFKEDAIKANNAQFTKEELGDELTPVIKAPVIARPKIIIEPIYEQPVTQAKPARAPINKVTSPPSTPSFQREPMDIDFEKQEIEPTQPTQPTLAAEQVAEVKHVESQLESQVIILSVVMPANQQMLGAALLPSLLTLGLKYGEMNIFHRHEDNAGKGKVTFSLANMMNPGSFDLDSMESFATRGVSLFMTLPNASDPFNVFEQMLNAAKQLAQEFNAQLIDDKRNVMTKQTEQHYIGKIREFDRKSRIALAE